MTTEKFCICVHCRGQCACYTGFGWTPHCSSDHPVAGAIKRHTPAPICDGMTGGVVSSHCEELAVGYLVNPDADGNTHRRYCQECGERYAAKANRDGLGWYFAALPGGVSIPAPGEFAGIRE